MVWTILLILFFFAYAYFAWRNIFWATATICALLPAYLIRFSLGPMPMTALEMMILILFAVWFIKLKFRKEKLNNPIKILENKKWTWPILAWLSFAIISMLISPDLRAAAGIFKAYFFEPLLFLLVLLSVVKTKKDLEIFFYALGFSALYISAFAIYQKFTGFAIPNPIWQAAETRRVTSFYGYPNAIGLYLAPIVILYAGLLISNIQYLISKIKKVTARYWLLDIGYLLLVIAASTASIIFARSEGAYVGILAGLFFLGLMTKKLRWPTVALALIFVTVIALVPQFRHYAVEQITFKNDSGKVRQIMWRETWQMLRDRLFSGAGSAGYQETFAPYHKAKYIEIYLYPHNLFLNFWTEMGLGGLIVFLLITIKFFKDTIKKFLATRQPLFITLSAVMITILVHGLVDVPYFKNDLAILFWLIIGLSLFELKKIPKNI
ncbi:O-antigen ligase family protein [Candidatus Falkowbacteria bacterium]|nr:O-antigen ligase family protein [Candidatus Falkowbacteria bacterium]